MAASTDTKVDLDKLIERALADPEIAPLRASSGLPDALTRQQVRKNLDEVLGAAFKEEEFLRQAEQLRDAANKRVGELKLPGSPGKVHKTVASLLILLTMAAYVVIGAKLGWKAPFRWPNLLWCLPPIVTISSLLWRGSALATGRRKLEEQERLALGTKLSVADLEKNAGIAQEQYETAIVAKGIVPELRELFGGILHPSYGAVLGSYTATGLSEVFDSSHEIDTAAKERINRALSTLPGASIGVAGPRGAGKTTLLASVYNRKAPQGEKPFLSVLCAAPIEYNARDFILNLFSLVCRRVLQDQGAMQETEALPLEALPTARFLTTETGLTVVRFLITMTRSIGIVLVVVGLWLAVMLMEPGPGTAQGPQSTPGPTAAAGQGQRSAAAPPPGVSRFLRALDVKPGPILLWGLLLTVLGFGLPLVLAPLQIRASIERRVEEEQKRGETPVGKEAYRQLLDLRFQQSYSSGWSGSLELPVGLEGGINSARSLAQNQKSLPELVENFRRFLQLATTEYSKVIIGIDELDKLESDEKAHLFLNEIKAVFGLPNVFYLVSVSENAISAFERRGLPFRDVFDSSFDTILYVDYLNLAGSRRLLQRRTTGVPEPFVCFCHCFSGGLPRDLIRACREMLAWSEENQVNDLPSLCRAIIKIDLEAKTQAMEIALARVHLEPETSRFVRRLAELRSAAVTSGLLVNACCELLKGAGMVAASEKKAPEISRESDRLVSLQREFAVYLCYSGTLLELFLKDRDPTGWKATEDSGVWDHLAKARQQLARSTIMGGLALSEFRRTQTLMPMELRLQE